MRKYIFQWAAVGILSLIGWGVDVMPANTSWIPAAVIWSVAFIWLIVSVIYLIRARKPASDKCHEAIALEITGIYEDNKGECGLIFQNIRSTNLTNCQARLIDIAFEIPHPRFSLERYPKAEDLICADNVAGFGDGKIPLFRWGWGMASKDLEIVYKGETHQIGYGILSVSILVLLNLWADNTSATYAVCRLSDRLGWGYDLSILETGVLKSEVKLVTYQKPSLDIDSSSI